MKYEDYIWERHKRNIVIAIIILSLVGLSQLVFGQEKKENVIIIHALADAGKIKEMLFNNGYTVDKSDSIFITTKEKSIKTCNISLSFMLKDTLIYLRGNLKMPVAMQTRYTMTEAATYDIYFGGMKGSPIRNAWNEMNRIAILLSDKVEYAKQ